MLHVVSTLLLLACSGGAPGTGEVDGPAVVPSRPDISCPEGTVLESGKSAKGDEQWCDRGGVMHGPYIRYYPDGTRAVKGSHDNNLPDGDWIWWHENKIESSKGKYVKGKQTGSWTWWHPNGNRAEEGDFLQGRKAGQWVSWYESGLKVEEGLYHNGMKNGAWTYYNDDPENTVARTERWENGAIVEEHGVDPRTKAPTPP
jgi:hypothetical protein